MKRGPNHLPETPVYGWALYEKQTGKMMKWGSGHMQVNTTRRQAKTTADEFEKTWGRAYYVRRVRIEPG